MSQKDLLDSIDYTFEERRALLLQKLKSPSNDPAKPYKRYPKTLMRYAGGKSLAVGLIAEKLPKNQNEYPLWIASYDRHSRPLEGV